ncbi:hypothetical protein N9924_01145 [bacterium]|nr:hypothetical protein [bacterium]
MKKLNKGDKVVSQKLVMVIVGETKTAYQGYHEYNGKIVGQCSLEKSMLTNPHYAKNIEIIKA